MKKILLLLTACLVFLFSYSQTNTNVDSLRNAKKDRTLRAMIHEDSLKVEKQFAETEKFDKLLARATYPLIKEAKMGGIIPLTGLTEIPDPTIEYKLLFELVQSNFDSAKTETDGSLSEVARIINLHVASGIPVNKIKPVIVVHASALTAISTDAYYKAHFKTGNPNLKLISELQQVGTKFIACGQAMTFFDIKREELLPDVKISLTAQTVLSSYQLKGYVLYAVRVDGK
jgi:intracellular sulfur oxidation DsrE/DsrF family protein